MRDPVNVRGNFGGIQAPGIQTPTNVSVGESTGSLRGVSLKAIRRKPRRADQDTHLRSGVLRTADQDTHLRRGADQDTHLRRGADQDTHLRRGVLPEGPTDRDRTLRCDHCAATKTPTFVVSLRCDQDTHNPLRVLQEGPCS